MTGTDDAQSGDGAGDDEDVAAPGPGRDQEVAPDDSRERAGDPDGSPEHAEGPDGSPVTADDPDDDELTVWIPRHADEAKREAFIEVALAARPGWTVLELIRVDEPDNPPYNLGEHPDEQDLLRWVYRLEPDPAGADRE
ncbi:hypothetical protein BH20ACT5_BH20ACT5_24840 [soil metagenome]